MSIFETGSTRQSTEQILLEVVRIKLSSSLNVSKSDKTLIIGYIEAHYGRAKKYRTKENKLYGGYLHFLQFNMRRIQYAFNSLFAHWNEKVSLKAMRHINLFSLLIIPRNCLNCYILYYRYSLRNSLQRTFSWSHAFRVYFRQDS